MSQRKWKIVEVNGYPIIVPVEPILCYRCNEYLILHHFACFSQERYGFYHCDVYMKCPICDWFTVFGIPVTREEYEKLIKSYWHNRVLLWEVKKFVEEEIWKKIEKKLRQWGYW